MTLRFPGLRVLLVEDESPVAMLVEGMLEDLGCIVLASPACLGEALESAAAAAFDFAILDVNLAGRPVFPVASVLAGRGIPFAFASGYGSDGLAPEFRDRPVVAKPFRLNDLAEAISLGLARAAHDA